MEFQKFVVVGGEGGGLYTEVVCIQCQGGEGGGLPMIETQKLLKPLN